MDKEGDTSVRASGATLCGRCFCISFPLPVLFILLWPSQSLAPHIPSMHFRLRLESLSTLCIWKGWALIDPLWTEAHICGAGSEIPCNSGAGSKSDVIIVGAEMAPALSVPLLVFFTVTFVYLCVGVCGDQRTACESWLSMSIMWVL